MTTFFTTTTTIAIATKGSRSADAFHSGSVSNLLQRFDDPRGKMLGVLPLRRSPLGDRSVQISRTVQTETTTAAGQKRSPTETKPKQKTKARLISAGRRRPKPTPPPANFSFRCVLKNFRDWLLNETDKLDAGVTADVGCRCFFDAFRA